MKNILKIALLSMMYSIGASESCCNYTDEQLSNGEVPAVMLEEFNEWSCKDAVLAYEREQVALGRVVFYHGAPIITALRQLIFTITYNIVFEESLPFYPLYNFLPKGDDTKNGNFLYATPGLFTNSVLGESEGNFRCPWAYVSGIIYKPIQESTINIIIESFFKQLSLGTLALIKKVTEDNATLSRKIEELLKYIKKTYSNILGKKRYNILYAISMPLEIAQEHVFIAWGKDEDLKEHPSGYKSWFDLMNNYKEIIESKYPYIEVGIPNSMLTCSRKASEYEIEVRQFGGDIPEEDKNKIKELVKILIEEIQKESLECYSKEEFDKRYFKQQ